MVVSSVDDYRSMIIKCCVNKKIKTYKKDVGMACQKVCKQGKGDIKGTLSIYIYIKPHPCIFLPLEYTVA